MRHLNLFENYLNSKLANEERRKKQQQKKEKRKKEKRKKKKLPFSLKEAMPLIVLYPTNFGEEKVAGNPRLLI